MKKPYIVITHMEIEAKTAIIIMKLLKQHEPQIHKEFLKEIKDKYNRKKSLTFKQKLVVFFTLYPIALVLMILDFIKGKKLKQHGRG